MKREQRESYEERYRSARKAFEEDENVTAAKELQLLIKDILYEIHDLHFGRLYQKADYVEKRELIAQEEDHKTWNLLLLARMFDAVDIFQYCDRGDLRASSILLRSFRYENIYDILESTKEGMLAEEPRILGLQQALCAVVSLLVSMKEMAVGRVHLIVNVQKLREATRGAETSKEKEEKLDDYVNYLTKEGDKSGKREKKFDWIKVRGMLINQDDRSRNVSFKCETFVNILENIHRGICRTFTEISDEPTASEKAADILFNAGWASGANFGKNLYSLFQQDVRHKTLREKIDTWCNFDSDVGFGMFGVDNVDSKESGLKVQVTLADNFIVVGKDASDVNLCNFMRGYIQGVLERVTKLPLIVDHKPVNCEQFNSECRGCKFEIETDQDELKKVMDLTVSSRRSKSPASMRKRSR